MPSVRHFGDVSGHFKSLLNDHCEIVVVAVVKGDHVAAGRCPKQTVRRIDNIPEAKWNDLRDHQKRRFFECFAENDNIEFGYARFTKEQLHSLEGYHHLYQESLNPAWDLVLTGYAYGELIFEMKCPEDRRDPILDFDRIHSNPQCYAVKSHVEKFVDSADVYFQSSRKNHGIQAADCLAGGIAEDFKSRTDWLGYLENDDITDANYTALAQLENDLTNI